MWRLLRVEKAHSHYTANLYYYHKKDFQSHRVPKRADGKWEMEVRSLPLCSLLKNRLNWEDGKSYRIPGKTYPKQRLAVFDLTAAEQIQKD